MAPWAKVHASARARASATTALFRRMGAMSLVPASATPAPWERGRAMGLLPASSTTALSARQAASVLALATRTAGPWERAPVSVTSPAWTTGGTSASRVATATLHASAAKAPWAKVHASATGRARAWTRPRVPSARAPAAETGPVSTTPTRFAKGVCVGAPDASGKGICERSPSHTIPGAGDVEGPSTGPSSSSPLSTTWPSSDRGSPLCKE